MQTEERKAYLRENMKRLRSNPEYRLKEAKQKKEWYTENKEKSKQNNKMYRLTHKAEVSQNHVDWVNKNREALKLYRKAYRLTENGRAKIQRNDRNKVRKRRQNDPNFVLYGLLQASIINSVKYQNSKKSGRTIELLNCTIEKFKQHLESKFHVNTRTGEMMTWNNRGKLGWHIDHIIPRIAFDLKEPSEQRRCFHWTNLQPLWWWENLEKGDKY